MVVSDIKMSQKLKNKGQFSIEKDISKCEKMKICYKYLKMGFKLPVHSNERKNQFSKENIKHLVSLIIGSFKRNQEVGFFRKV